MRPVLQFVTYLAIFSEELGCDRLYILVGASFLRTQRYVVP